jgi:hypothetical protein
MGKSKNSSRHVPPRSDAVTTCDRGQMQRARADSRSVQIEKRLGEGPACHTQSPVQVPEVVPMVRTTPIELCCIVRARFKIGMMKLHYNIRRLDQLERAGGCVSALTVQSVWRLAKGAARSPEASNRPRPGLTFAQVLQSLA